MNVELHVIDLTIELEVGTVHENSQLTHVEIGTSLYSDISGNKIVSSMKNDGGFQIKAKN